MDEGNGNTLTITCECGNTFKESLAGKDLETEIFTCPQCGGQSQLGAEQIADVAAAVADAKKQLSEALAAVSRSSKTFTYRPD